MASKSLHLQLVRPEQALPGRSVRMPVPGRHFVLGTSLEPADPHLESALFGMGCFWGAERKFWQASGVHSTAVGYAGGFTPNPTYEEVCTGMTGHAEVVRVWYDPQATSFAAMLQIFWENHDPTQGMRQGNDVGTQYRSAIFTQDNRQRSAAERSRDAFQGKLREAGFGPITTEIAGPAELYYAEEYHQQYLAKNPRGYCGLGGTGVSCPAGLVSSEVPGPGGA